MHKTFGTFLQAAKSELTAARQAAEAKEQKEEAMEVAPAELPASSSFAPPVIPATPDSPAPASPATISVDSQGDLPTPSTPQLQRDLARLDKAIACLSVDALQADPAVSALLVAKRADKEELLTLIHGSKPLHSQVKAAAKTRDETRKSATQLTEEVQICLDILAIKQDAAKKAELEADQAQQAYLTLAAKHAEEQGISVQPLAAPTTVAPELIDAIVALRDQLPAAAAMSLHSWAAANILTERPQPQPHQQGIYEQGAEEEEQGLEEHEAAAASIQALREAGLGDEAESASAFAPFRSAYRRPHAAPYSEELKQKT